MKRISTKRLDKYLLDCIKKKKFPGCVCWVGSSKETYFFESYGYAQIIPGRIKINKETIFDIASLTKPLATANTIMKLYEKKEIKLTDKIEKYLQEFKNRINGKKTIKELLTHTSGIPAWFPVYILPHKQRMEFLSSVNTTKKEVIYSCLGYIILGKIAEKITKLSLGEYCKENIFKKLQSKNTMFKPGKKITNIAATEFGNEHEKKMASEYGDISSTKWRNYIIKGEVHDGNAFYAYKGVAGNAGLFSNVSDLIKIVNSYLAGAIVKSSTVKLMIKNHTNGTEPRGLGWGINRYPGILSPRSFGHTGFTGAMIIVDPKIDLIIILLTNVVHPKVIPDIMIPIRKQVIKIVTQ